MQYIKEDGSKLIIKKEYEHDNSYWILVDYIKIHNKQKSLYPTNMNMQIFVKDGDIINKSLNVYEGPTAVGVFSHNHDNRESFDESFINVHSKDYYNIKEKKDSMVLDNIKISLEEEEIIITELLKNNNINVNVEELLKLFQKDLCEYKRLTKDDLDEEKEYIEIETIVENIIKTIRIDTFRQKIIKSQLIKKNR